MRLASKLDDFSGVSSSPGYVDQRAGVGPTPSRLVVSASHDMISRCLPVMLRTTGRPAGQNPPSGCGAPGGNGGALVLRSLLSLVCKVLADDFPGGQRFGRK